MIYLFLSLSIAVFLHLLAMAVTARMFGVSIVEFSYGVGPKIGQINNIIIKLIPISGHVKMLDSREQDLAEHELQFAYDHTSRFVRSFIIISGCIFLILIAFILIGSDAFYSLLDGFRQIVTGILSPTETAQVYIENIGKFIYSSSFLAIFSMTATKIAAVNLLPIPILNGGQALLELCGVSDKNKAKLFKFGSIFSLLMLLSLAIALITYLWL